MNCIPMIDLLIQWAYFPACRVNKNDMFNVQFTTLIVPVSACYCLESRNATVTK